MIRLQKRYFFKIKKQEKKESNSRKQSPSVLPCLFWACWVSAGGFAVLMNWVRQIWQIIVIDLQIGKGCYCQPGTFAFIRLILMFIFDSMARSSPSPHLIAAHSCGDAERWQAGRWFQAVYGMDRDCLLTTWCCRVGWWVPFWRLSGCARAFAGLLLPVTKLEVILVRWLCCMIVLYSFR